MLRCIVRWHPCRSLQLLEIGNSPRCANQRIRRVDAATRIISTIAGNGTQGYSGDGGPATAASLYSPLGIAVDAAGNIFVTDAWNGRIRRVDAATGVITTIAGRDLNSEEDYLDSGPATTIRLVQPTGVAVDPTGNVLIADGTRVMRVDAATGVMSRIAGNGSVYSGDGDPATDAGLSAHDIAVDGAGNVLVAGIGNRIRRVDAVTGIITTIAGNGARGYSGDGGPATAARLDSPYGIAADAAGNMLIADSHNNIVRQVLSLLGAGIATIVPDPTGREVYLFDDAGRHAQTRNTLTGEVLLSFAYDPAGRITEVRDGNGNVTSIERDADGNPLAIVAPFGQRTTLTVDPNGYLAAVTNPAGETVHMTYTADGLITRMEDARGNAAVMTYDAAGRLLSESDAAGGSQTLAKTGSASTYQTTRTTALGRTSTHLVENLSTGDRRQTDTAEDGSQNVRLIKTDGTRSTALASGIVDTIVEGPDPRFSMLAPLEASHTTQTPSGTFLSRSQARSVTLSDPQNPFSLTGMTETETINGRSSRTAFDASTKTFTSTSAGGRQSTKVIDGQGRTTNQGITGLVPVDSTYDPQGRLATTSRGSGAASRLTSYAYNAAGFLDTITDALSRTIGLQYDLAGRVTMQTLPDGRQIQFAYDPKGNITALTPPGRPAHRFEYTTVDLVSRYIPPDVGAGTNATEYAYNADRQITQVRRPDGNTIDSGYDAAGRLATIAVVRGTYTNTYDAAGRLASITAPDGGTVSYTYDGDLLLTTTWTGAVNGSVSRTYDNDFRVSSISVNGADPISYTCDADGLLIGAGALNVTRDPQDGLVTGTALGNVTDSMTYNEFGELVGYVACYGGADLYSYQLTRDKLGRITGKVETVEGVTDTYGYQYDLAGRLVEVAKNGTVVSSYTYDSNGNRLTGPGLSAPATYDDQDRLLQYGSATYAYTAAGELASKTDAGQTTTYAYDELGNLLAVNTASASINYVIDAANHRVGKGLDGGLGQGFLWQDDLRPVAELDGTGAVVSRFVYAEHVNVPEYMVKSGATYRFIMDHLGSPRLLLDSATGTIVQRMDFDEFGRVQADSNPGSQCFGFAGGVSDRDTGLTRFAARDYDAYSARWITKDPIGFGGFESNLYGYVGGDAVNRTDPRGLQFQCKMSKDQQRKQLLDLLEREARKKTFERMLPPDIEGLIPGDISVPIPGGPVYRRVPEYNPSNVIVGVRG